MLCGAEQQVGFRRMHHLGQWPADWTWVLFSHDRAGQWTWGTAQSLISYLWQVQFDEREDTKSCTIVINDDDVFENAESFFVELSMPAYALLGKFTQAKVIINDTEDEPTLEFDKKTYRVNESAGFLFAPIERKGLLVPKVTRRFNVS